MTPFPRFHYLILAALAAVGAWWHMRTGLSLPFPCGDEVVFYYPAQALANHGTLASIHLLPGRELFWMPPGYMAVLAVWIKTIGEGLVGARWLSFGFAALALVGFWRFWLRMRLPPEGLWLLGVAYVSRHWVVMGNMARMEGLLLCLLLLTLTALWEGKTLAAAGLALLALTVHPNAIYFVAGMPALAALSPRRTYGGCLNLSVAALGGLAVAVYGIHVLQNLSHFVYDWRWQFSTRSTEGVRILLFRPDQAVFFAGLCGLGYWAWRGRRRHIGFVLVLAVLFWMMRVLGQGWSYGMFNVLALTLVLGCGLAWARERAWPWLARAFSPQATVERYAPHAAAIALALALGVAGIYTLPFFRPADYHWMGMPMQRPGKPYLTSDDVSQIRQRLYQALPPGKVSKVYFMPEGEGIAIAPWDTGRLRHVFPIFGQNLPDWFVVRRSALAAFYTDAFRETLEMLPPGVRLPPPFYIRQKTEAWYLIPVQAGRYPPYILLEGDPKLPAREKR